MLKYWQVSKSLESLDFSAVYSRSAIIPTKSAKAIAVGPQFDAQNRMQGHGTAKGKQRERKGDRMVCLDLMILEVAQFMSRTDGGTSKTT